MDTLSAGDSPLHRLDPRAKLITTLLFIVTVVSFDKYTLSAFLPFFLYPAALITSGKIPARYIINKVLLVCPFAILIGIFNPIIDTQILFHIGNMEVSDGWVSFFSIIIKSLLTVSAALILISLTGFNAVCEALIKLGIPRPFVIQLLFFYRYLFVLTDEAQRMDRARALRSFNTSSMKLYTFSSFIGHLLLRTLDRAERIYLAMCSRGFNGHIHMTKTIKNTWKEFSFVAVWVSLFLLFRLYNIPVLLGDLVTGVVK